MYKKGLLRQVDPPCKNMDCDELGDEHRHSVLDARTEDADATKYPAVYLPHSCDKWVIGGVEEICALISDLKSMLQAIEANKEEKQ